LAALNQISSLLQIVLGKPGKAGGAAYTGTFNPQQTERTLTLPGYQEHLTDIFASRAADDSRSLIKNLIKTDPDMSATVNSYLTLANTEPLILVRDLEGEIDKDATKELLKAIKLLTAQVDYTLGFQNKRSLASLCEEMRFMVLMRGAIGTELILDKQLAPTDLRMVDMASVRWYEKKPGEYKPIQEIQGGAGGSNEISLDIPTFFVSFYRRDPTTIYTYSPFISAINTIAARQQVINDLYRIMQKTGYPRMDVKVVEEVLEKSVPASIKTDMVAKQQWMNSRLNEVRSAIEGIRADQAFVHFDSVEPSIINDKAPGVGINIDNVIETLNAQNQAGLKTMSTVIGRGTAGINTSSVEARIAAMNADELNIPVAETLTKLFSFILHQTGYQGFAEVSFANAELRPDLELETMRALKVARLRQDLSDGLITDMEYHLQMYGRLPPDGAPELSGTNFMNPVEGIDASKASPNSDPLGRSLAPKGGQQSKSNATPRPANAA
jgi:hypothetical protein